MNRGAGMAGTESEVVAPGPGLYISTGHRIEGGPNGWEAIPRSGAEIVIHPSPIRISAKRIQDGKAVFTGSERDEGR